VEGYITVGNGAKMFYGGGLCGVATAFYQGTLTNLGLSLLKYRAHSTYYRNLYEAEINGVMITDPGLDATVYTPLFDVKVKNIRDYPIVVGFNFDGLSGSMEQVFTLSKAQDRGSFAFVGSYKKA
jgi:vancomycin resistance protein YoaR